jgi:hypothetical protein
MYQKFLQIPKMSDEVVVSSLPHPISMFLLGIFAITIIFMWIEVQRSAKRKEKVIADLEAMKTQLFEFKTEMNGKFTELSKKIDSRVDKAILTLKKEGKTDK